MKQILNAPGGQRVAVTSHDVAREAGVSQSTVSRALSGDARVREETRRRVVEAASRLGYSPNALGRSLRTRSNRTVGLVVTDLTNLFYPFLIAPLHDELELHGYRMVLVAERLEGTEAPDGAALERLLDGSIDGAILATSTIGSSVPAELRRRGVPFVFLTRVTEGIGADAVVVDNALGASLAGNAVARFGHTRVGAVFGPVDTSTGRDRERGVRSALAAAEVELLPEAVHHGPYAPETGARAVAEMMALDDPPTAILCFNDMVAVGALNAARALGIAVPAELTVIGFDDLPLASWPVFQLTTVHQPMEEMARTAARLLLDRIEGRAGEEFRQITFEPRLVLRASHAPPHRGDRGPSVNRPGSGPAD